MYKNNTIERSCFFNTENAEKLKIAEIFLKHLSAFSAFPQLPH